MNSILPMDFKLAKRSKLGAITIRGYGGGLNTVDDDLDMASRFQCDLLNLKRSPNGQTLRLREGTGWFANVAGTITGNILNATYFNTRLVIVSTTGQIATITDNGAKAKIWDSVIASALPGAPAGWSSGLTSIDFVPFKDRLIIHNGVDKPLSINSGYATSYLQDEATGSNVAVPIGKFGCVSANYHCIAGIAGAPTTIYISSSGTAGVFPGDPPPNDSISIDVGAYAPEGAASIRGIKGFRSHLIVFFQQQSILIQLGNYNEAGVHTPEFPDSMPQFGMLGHRCAVSIENDLVFSGFGGLSTAKRNLFTGLVDSQQLSDNINNLYSEKVDALTSDQQMLGCFMVRNHHEHESILYLPTGFAFVHCANEKKKYESLTTFSGPIWTCGCTSYLGRVFLCIGTKVFQVGNNSFADETFTADMVADRDEDWSALTTYAEDDLVRDTDTDESYVCSMSHTSGGGTFEEDREAFPLRWTLYEGEEIEFALELPWFDGRDPEKLKHLKFAKVASKGSAEFDLLVYVDNLYKNEVNEVIYDPALRLSLIGNLAGGFGYDVGPFGGGRRSGDPRLYKFPCKFKSLKIRIEGSTTRPLTLGHMTFLFAKGLFKR